MRAIIVSVGTELTTGQTVDTNSAFLSRQLAMRGIAVLEHITVGDDRTAIAAAIAQAVGKAGLVIVSGGLGPTEDDLTRAAMADVLGCELTLNGQCLAEIEAFFAARNRPMNEVNKIQAMIPAKAAAISNHVGTAPGIVAELAGSRIFVVPGVPSEMEWMYHSAIEPALPTHNGIILHRIIHTFGAGESDVGAKIADLMQRGGNPLVGTTVAAGMVSIRIVAHAASLDEAQAMTDRVAVTLRQRLGELVIGENEQTMPMVLGQMLRDARQTVSTAESCTGGLLGKILTDVAGSSDYYVGGVISYSNRLKTALLGVSEQMLAEHGAVSDEVAVALAQGARERLQSDWGISITGIAGPGGGTATKPVGLVCIGLAGPGVAEVQRQIWPGTREIIRLRSALAAMNMLRLKLLK